MGQAASKTLFTAADYLAWEPAQAERHEYLDGEVFATVGAQDRHVTVSMNLADRPGHAQHGLLPQRCQWAVGAAPV